MDHNNLVDLLEEIGLSEKEAKIYLALLELREALPGVIARKAGVKRPTTYVVLEQLKKKGVISHAKKKEGLCYRPVDPKFLLKDQESRTRRLEKALPELMGLNRMYGITPQMSVFEGKEGIIQIMEDTLTSSTELLCWCNGDLALKSFGDYYPRYVARKAKLGLWLKGVFTYDQAAIEDKKNAKKELREAYLVPKEIYPIKNEINIYDDKVAIISHEDEVGVIIQNKDIADTQRAIFMMTFEYAKTIEPGLLTAEDWDYIKAGG
jgi:HTH-type transcriptional regulator, sugar sensing transcriptional regulator